MKKKAARMACIAMACLILGSLSGEVYASTISEIKKQQEEDKKKLNSVQGEISGLEGDRCGTGADHRQRRPYQRGNRGKRRTD